MHSRFSVQHGCVLVVMLLSAVMSASYYVLTLAVPLYAKLPYPAATAVAVGVALLALALDILKPSMIALSVESAQHRRWASFVGSIVMAVLLIIISLWAVDGLLLMLRGWATGSSTEQITSYDVHAKRLTELEVELRTIPPTRTARQIEIDMSKSGVDPGILRRTNYCDPAQITKDESREACKRMTDLKLEMARVNKRAELEARFEIERRWVNSNERPATPDQQVALAAEVFGVSQALVTLLRWSALGFVIEIVLILVPALLAARRPMLSIQPMHDITPLTETGRTQAGTTGRAIGGEAGTAGDGKVTAIAGPATADATQEAANTAKRILVRLLTENGNRLKVTNKALAGQFSTSPIQTFYWRRRWVEEGLIEEVADGGHFIITPGRAFFKAPAKLYRIGG